MLLKVLPVQEVNHNIHWLIQDERSEDKVFETKIETNSKLFLGYCQIYKHLSVHSQSAHKKKMNIVKRFAETELVRCVSYVRNIIQFQLAGIEPFWKSTRDGRLEVRFYVNLTKIKWGDLEKKLGRLSHYRVAPVINKFIDQESYFAELFEIDNKNQNPDVRNIPFILEEVERTTMNWKGWANLIIDDLPSCKLMEYQKMTVSWMVGREKEPAIECLNRFWKLDKVRPPKGARNPTPLYYHPSFGLFTEKDKLAGCLHSEGGILADESGLGKTLEVVSLILSNPKNEIVSLPMSKKTVKKREEKSRKCAKCQELCDLEDSGWKEEFDEREVRFCCLQCIATQPHLDVKTTLIGAPESLIPYWFDEISKNNLKVKIYSGMDVDGYLHPLEIASHDVILVSYETMKTELSHTSKKVTIWDSKSKLKKTQNNLVTSLSHVNWWRLVCDESQMINNPGCRPAQFCQLISSINRWCVTSTPIKDNYSDLFALFKLIQFWPFNIEQFWKIAVLGFNDFIKKKLILSNSLLIRLTSQIMRRTKKSTVIEEMSLPKMVEIERVVKLTPIEDFRYKKEIEDLKQEVWKVIDKAGNSVVMNDVNEKEKIFEMIENLKETLISGGEHDKEIRLKNIAEEIHSEPKSRMIRQLNDKKTDINDVLEPTAASFLNVAEIYDIDNIVEAAKAYSSAADVIELLDELNDHFERIKSPTIINLSDGEEVHVVENRMVKWNRKRGPIDITDKPRKIRRVEVSVALKARNEISEINKSVASPILISEKLTTRFLLNMLEMHKKLPHAVDLNNVINRMGGTDKLQANLYSIIERCSKEEADAFQNVRRWHEEIVEEWDTKRDRHIGMCKALEEIGEQTDASSQNLGMELMMSTKANSIVKTMSFWPVFKNSHKHFRDGKSGSNFEHDTQNCMGVCNNSNFLDISEIYEVATNHELFQHLFNYINGLENLREEVMTSYTRLVSKFQVKYLNTTAVIHEESTTLLCRHKHDFDIVIDENKRSMMKYIFPCLICSTRFSLSHLSFELGVGSFHGDERTVRGKLAIEKFLTIFLAEVQKLHPNFDFSKQFNDFVEYIEHIRRTVNDIRSGCDDIQKYSYALRKLYYMQKPYDLVALQRSHEGQRHEPIEKVKEFHLNMHITASNNRRKNLKKLCADFRFLASLYKKEDSNEEGGGEDSSCPVCIENWRNLNGFVGFPCGHRLCQNCYPHFRNQQQAHRTINRLYMKCSICRKDFMHSDVFVARENSEQSLAPEDRLSAKLMETIKLMREIVAKGVDENVVLFTTSEVGSMMWKYLANVFEKAELPFAESAKIQRGSLFRFSAECRILMCSHGMYQMCLDVTNANNVIFLDPTDSLSSFERSMNRVMRIGQKRDVTVYHMLVESSVDNDIRRVCKAENGWTVGDTRKIFNIPFNEAEVRDELNDLQREFNRIQGEIRNMMNRD